MIDSNESCMVTNSKQWRGGGGSLTSPSFEWVATPNVSQRATGRGGRGVKMGEKSCILRTNSYYIIPIKFWSFNWLIMVT